jgi:hypothetical protein
MNLEDSLGMVLLFLVFGIPALGLTARLAIQPVVEAILRLRESFAIPPSPVSDERLQRLEAEVGRIARAVERLQDAGDFERGLRSGSGSPAGALSAPATRSEKVE